MTEQAALAGFGLMDGTTASTTLADFVAVLLEQGALADLDEALSYERRAVMALRCRGATKLMLGDLKVTAVPQ